MRQNGHGFLEETSMAQSTRVNLAIGATIVALAAFGAAPAHAQETCKVNEDVLAKNTKYTEQHIFNIDDTPGHIIRIFELVRMYPDDKPNCEGLKRTQSLGHLSVDYVNGNGPLHGYTTLTYENGDKIFEETYGISQTVTNPDGSKKGSFSGVTRYVGGTGKYQRVQGVMREKTEFDIAAGFNQSHTEGEYWIEK
jgi:hypothetical protein